MPVALFWLWVFVLWISAFLINLDFLHLRRRNHPILDHHTTIAKTRRGTLAKAAVRLSAGPAPVRSRSASGWYLLPTQSSGNLSAWYKYAALTGSLRFHSFAIGLGSHNEFSPVFVVVRASTILGG
jgi:hypothetical protein